MEPITYPSFETLPQSLTWLKQQGYTLDFDFGDGCIVSCNADQAAYTPEDFQIDHVFRFEKYSDPDGEGIVYAISSEKFQAKGVLVSASGGYANSLADELIARMPVRHQPSQTN
jgi:hypothetical protein